jgi:hypothetical protein
MREALTLRRDGIAGADLGIIGAWQYAYTPAPGALPRPAYMASAVIEPAPLSAIGQGSIYRRRADERGSYGGWRWECPAAHPARFPNDAHLAELAARIAAAAGS